MLVDWAKCAASLLTYDKAVRFDTCVFANYG